MRNLEDCKAEVFRRSEERIKERKKKRNHVLAWCIPLCLLLVAGGLYIRPLLEPVDESMTSGDTSKISDRELGGLTTGTTVAFTSVTITSRTENGEVSRSVADATAVEELLGFLAMYFDVSGVDAIGGLDGADGATGGLEGTTGKESVANGTDWDTIEDEIKFKYYLEDKPADYTLVFRESTGREREFRLYENNLYNESSGCVVMLSDVQLVGLKELLQQAMEKENGK